MKNGDEEAFEELLQLGQFANVESYQRRFQELAAIVNDLPAEFCVRCFTKGLREDIKFGVEMYKPTTMDQAIGLAKLQEMTLEAVAMRSDTRGTLLPINKPNTINATTTPLVPQIQKIIGEKIEHRESTLPVQSIVCESVPMVGATSNKEIDELKANRESKGHVHGQNSAKNVFDASKFEIQKTGSIYNVNEHALDELIELRQWSTVGEYRKQFLVVANKIEGLSEIFLISRFVCGLQEEIRAGVQDDVTFFLLYGSHLEAVSSFKVNYSFLHNKRVLFNTDFERLALKGMNVEGSQVVVYHGNPSSVKADECSIRHFTTEKFEGYCPLTIQAKYEGLMGDELAVNGGMESLKVTEKIKNDLQ